MVISIKNAIKLVGITIMCFCAAFVCNLFLNFNIDVMRIESELTAEYQKIFYDAVTATGKVVSSLSGGCLLITSIVMLIFYIKQYINSHSKELGILKALGYSNLKISKDFWIFGLSVFVGTIMGYFLSFLLMPMFYEKQNEEGILPEISIHINLILLLLLVILPSMIFAVLSITFAFIKLKRPVMKLLKEIPDIKIKKFTEKDARSKKEMPFLTELRKTTLKSKKTLVFLIAFASFCFSSMMQMSFSMDELASEMFAIMIFMIGITLSFTTLFLGISTVINANGKTIAMLKVEGYNTRQCESAIFGGYRPISYIGFAIGTLYQYMLLKIMVEAVFADFAEMGGEMPEYGFDVKAFIICLITFTVIYELMMRYCGGKIKKCPIKQIMESGE